MALEKYTDPGYDTIDQGVEAKLGLPSGLLTAVRTRGERTNADQVSSAKAKTVYQVIPETRDAILAKYKIDPWLSPENAALGAGYLLKEGLERNRGDASQAVGEYVGGLDRKNWGPVTKSYINRVMTGFKAPAAEAPQQGGRRLTQELAAQQPSQPSIAKIFQAYQSGEMPADIASEFEADVRAGKVLLPRGSEIKAAPAAPVAINAAVMKAYTDGTMPPDVRAELEADVKAGRAVIESVASQIPGQTGGPVTALPTPEAPAPSLGDRAIRAAGLAGGAPGALVGELLSGNLDKVRGNIEAGLGLATGLTGGALGMAGGAIGGLAGSIVSGQYGTPEGARGVEQSAIEGAETLTRQPRGAEGQQQLQAIGETMMKAVPVMPLTGEMAQAGRAAAAAAPSARVAAGTVAQQTAAAAQQIPAAVRALPSQAAQIPARVVQAMGREPAAAPLPRGSVGAAATPQELLRTTKAENLPVPIELTEGAKTREAAQLAFEKEQIKGPLGAPLRARAEENNLQALQNFETLIDKTEAQAPDIAATGNKVVSALSEGYKAAKNETNVAYAKARNSPEAALPVDPATVVTIGEGDNALTTSLIDHLNSTPSNLKTTGLTDHAKQYAVRLGVAEMGDDGMLIPKKTDVRTMEALRKEISQATGYEPVEIRDSTILKKLIDANTEPLAGPLYKKARQLREQQARKFENRAIVARLIENRKGMEDPKVAIDQVFQKSIMSGSPEEITFLKRVLNTSGENGQQAWRELQGATLKHIRDEATKGMGMDSADRPIVSPHKLHQIVTQLDKNNRLDIVLGKKGGEIVRDLNDVVRYVNTAPPNTLINTSGTAGVLLAAMAEAGTTGALTGLPIPALSILRMLASKAKERKLRARIEDALRKSEEPSIAGQGSKL